MTATARPQARAVDRHAFLAFGGGRCEILACGAPPDAVSAAVADVYAFEERLSRFLPGSELSRLNARAGERVAVSPLLATLLEAAVEAHALTGGLVNIAILPQLLAAGYDASIEVVRRRERPAPAAEPLRPRPLPDALELGDGWARLRPGCALDLGGVAKGWLADRLAERLEDAVVNLGGDLRARGGGPDGEGWSVELCDGSRLRARNAGVATSGAGGRRWPGGHHLVDPRTGAPATSGILAASVVAADALAAEALAKSVAILGALAGPAFAVERGAAHVAVLPAH
ncbi:MAG TPA: FAD:protein FMN transferase, partial [Candidatus Dormibacteraeota bacterium]|nr:FAD:protein FMN transferase [Candidatus Dormibacteraeota bacterium]